MRYLSLSLLFFSIVPIASAEYPRSNPPATEVTVGSIPPPLILETPAVEICLEETSYALPDESDIPPLEDESADKPDTEPALWKRILGAAFIKCLRILDERYGEPNDDPSIPVNP